MFLKIFRCHLQPIEVILDSKFSPLEQKLNSLQYLHTIFSHKFIWNIMLHFSGSSVSSRPEMGLEYKIVTISPQGFYLTL